MKPKLQVWRFDESDYERPDALWVCGWAADGHPCRTGPDAKGRCQTIAECRPVKDGARWRCTRSSFAGGPCGEGPKDDGTCGRPVTPCQPARSAKAKRGAATLAAFVAAAGIVLAALGGDRTATAFVSPGRLAPPHAARGLECAQCHVAAETRDWVGAALTGLDDARPGIPGPAVAGSAGDAHTAPRILADAEKCLACHEPESRPLIMRAHGSPRGALGTTWGMSPRRDPSALPCGTCHIEHQGATFDPRGIDDARCDACHAKKIRSFGPGHPEFTALGTGLGHITFDHSSKTHAAERCADCHVPDESSDGRFLALRSFEIACARCHTVGITGSDPTSFRDPASLQRLPDAREATFAEDLRALACFVPGNPAAVGTAATLAATLPPEELAALPPPLPAAAIAKRP